MTSILYIRGAEPPAFPHVGQVVNLRAIVNRPAAVVICVHLWPKIFLQPRNHFHIHIPPRHHDSNSGPACPPTHHSRPRHHATRLHHHLHPTQTEPHHFSNLVVTHQHNIVDQL